MGFVGLQLVFPPDGIIALWPAAGLAAGILAISRPDAWPALLTGIAAASLCGSLFASNPPEVSLAVAAVHCIEPLIGALLLRRWMAPRVSLRDTRGAFFVALGPGLIAPVIGGLLGATAITALSGNPGPFWQLWWRWSASSAVGVLLVLPLVIATPDMLTTLRLYRRRRLELIVLVGMQLVLSGVVFGGHITPDTAGLMRPELVFVPLIWAAIRLGPGEASLLCVLSILVDAWCTSQGLGPIAAGASTSIVQVFEVQAWLLVVIMLTLLLATGLEELRRAHALAMAEQGAIHEVLRERNEKQEETLRKIEQRFRCCFDDAPIGMALASIAPENMGRFMAANQALRDLLGYKSDELTMRSLGDLTHPEDLAEDEAALGEMAAGCRSRYVRETRYLASGGRVVWAKINLSAIVDDRGRPTHVIAHIEDITARKEFEHKLTYQALHDELTGLANRRLLLDRLQHALNLRERDRTSIALLYIDLDHFKRINDAHGHEAGDALLIEVSRRLLEAVRAGDTVARLGGDEFIALCPQVVDEEDAERIARRIETLLAAPVDIGGELLSVSASIGVLLADGTRNDPSELLRSADTAMYRAKEGGRGRYELFREALLNQALERAQLEQDLRHALDDDRFRLHFQPIVALESGMMTGMEALLRMEHPTRGLLAPGGFIKAAEDSGLIVPIGEWVLRDAMRKQKALAAQLGAPVRIAVNVSGRQIRKENLADVVMSALEATGADPHGICIEITESEIVEVPDSFVKDLVRLKELGVRVALDDFGTGYSSLIHLKRLPVDIVKIDRSFVAGLGERPDDTAIVTAIVALCRALGISVVAEGVETVSQLELLREMGVEFAQGYFFSRPRPVDELQKMLVQFPTEERTAKAVPRLVLGTWPTPDMMRPTTGTLVEPTALS